MNNAQVAVYEHTWSPTRANAYTVVAPAVSTAADTAVETVWATAVQVIRERAPGSFDQWFSGVQFDAFIDGIVSLRARNEFVRDWVDEHFAPALRVALEGLSGFSIRFVWSIDAALARPVVERPSPSPIRARPLMVPPRSDLADAAGAAFAPAQAERPVGLGALGESGIFEVASLESAHEPPASSRVQRSPSNARDARDARCAPPVVGLIERYTFANFVVGGSNQLAHAASAAAAGGSGPRHNPIFMCGGTGLGKTHLVHAVAHRVRRDRPEARIIYTSAERFVNEFVGALAEHKMNEFRAKYREQCDLLIVDDIHFLSGKAGTQEEFFHAFNALHQAGKQILVTSDKYPQQLEKMEERLVSRFAWGLVADIQAPDLETRVAIVRRMADSECVHLPDEVTLHIAQSVRNNVRELEGALTRLLAKASLSARTLDLDFVRTELATTMPVRANESSIDDIQRAVCHHFKLRSGDLSSKDRHKTIALARHVAMYLCKQRLRASYPEIGRAFGNRDHTTVMSGVRKVDAMRATDSDLRAHLEVIDRRLGGLD